MTALPARRWLPAAWFGLLVAAITAPWWAQGGYVWLLDSVWGPVLRIDFARPTMNLLWQVVAHVLAGLISAPAAEKLVLSGVLWSAGAAGYFLARRLTSRGWSLAAGTLYLLNPFVYERLLAGQWIVLAGYALLPVAIALAWDALESGGRHGAYRLAAVLALYPLVSPHFAYMNAFLTVALALVFIVVRRPDWLWSRRTGLWAAEVAVVALAANWFWLTTPAGRAYQVFTSLDFTTFRTAADSTFGVWGNVLGLYGFWRGMAFIEPKNWLGPAWFIVALIIVSLAALGAVRAFRARQPLAVTLALAAPVAFVLAVGYGSPIVRPLIDLLITYLPGFRGLRDTSKIIGVLALAYAVLAPYGAATVTARLPKWRATTYLAPATLMVLAAVTVTGLWDGAGHQVPVANYPVGWYRVSALLARTPSATVAVLPWHDYLSLNFAGNNYVAQPAAVFFKNPLLSSDEIDNIAVSRPDNAADRLMLAFTNGEITPQDWATQLRRLGASYIVLEKTDNAAIYAPKLSGSGLTLRYQDATIALYQLPQY